MKKQTDNDKSSPIKLGLLAPLSGLVELYGPEISWAATIATKEINEQGGVLGRPLELVIADDGSLPDKAVPAAIRLIEEEKCSAIIGNLLSNSRIAVANQVAEPRQVPYLNFSFYEGSIRGHYFFHFAALPNQQISKMIPYMLDHYGSKVFFAGSNYEWPLGSIDAAKKVLNKVGGEIVGEDYFPLGTNDFSGLLDRVAKSGANIFVPYFAGSDQLNLLTQFTQRGLKSRMAVVMGHYDEAMVAKLPPEVREGFYSSNTYFMGIESEENKSYLKRLAQHPEVNGIAPLGNGVLTNFGEGTYLCVKAFAKAAETAGSVEPSALVKALEWIAVKGPQGEVVMDALTHHARVNSYLARCNYDGTFTIVEQFGRIDPVIPDRYKRINIPKSTKQKTTQQLTNKSMTKGRELTQNSRIELNSNTTEQILAKADIAILAINMENKIVQANEAMVKMFGYTQNELIGLSLNELLPPRFRHGHTHFVQSFVDSYAQNRDMSYRNEIAGYRKDGSEFPASATISKFMSPDGWVMVATLKDISKQENIKEQLQWQATHDPLTDLPNRKLIQDRLVKALERSEKSGQSVALLFLDLDNFKLINDSYGHTVGDHLLVKIAQLLISHIRPGDTVARFGGDEFLVLCEEVTDALMVDQIASKLAEAFMLPMVVEDLKFYITASIGIAMAQGISNEAETLISNADTAMYAAKERGRNRWQIYDETLRHQMTEQLCIGNDLRNALANDEFYPVFQPIMGAQSQQIVGAELLLRWKTSRGNISPAIFIPIAEMTGAVVPIGEWVFSQACQASVQWQEIMQDESPPYISVNVSARQLSEPDIVQKFMYLLGKWGANPARIVLEVTETALMTDMELNQDVLHKFSSLGLKIAIDDFGTGYSSLGKLIHLPIDNLKIDKIFIDELGKRKDSHAVTSAIISMAHAMGMHVIAEGVEVVEQLEILKSLSCDTIQGYYFYKPMPASGFEALLSTQRDMLITKKEGIKS